jgi:hypothetical protein
LPSGGRIGYTELMGSPRFFIRGVVGGINWGGPKTSLENKVIKNLIKIYWKIHLTIAQHPPKIRETTKDLTTSPKIHQNYQPNLKTTHPFNPSITPLSHPSISRRLNQTPICFKAPMSKNITFWVKPINTARNLWCCWKAKKIDQYLLREAIKD